LRSLKVTETGIVETHEQQFFDKNYNILYKQPKLKQFQLNSEIRRIMSKIVTGKKKSVQQHNGNN
jgi:hypothetical protein